MHLFTCNLIYHGVSLLRVLPLPPPFLVRKRMEIIKKRIMNVSHKDNKRAFSIERDGGGRRTAWGCKEQSRACLQRKKGELNGESQSIDTTDYQMPL